MAYHEARKLVAVDQYNSLAQQLGGLRSGWREGRSCDEQTLVRLEAIQAAEEVADRSGPNIGFLGRFKLSPDLRPLERAGQGLLLTKASEGIRRNQAYHRGQAMLVPKR